MDASIARLRASGIRPTAQRIAVARCVLRSQAHPSAERILRDVRKISPRISRASVYNALELFVRKGLLAKRPLQGGRSVYDPIMEPHHHFIDEGTGNVYDIPESACQVRLTKPLHGFDVRDFQIVLRGRKTA